MSNRASHVVAQVIGGEKKVVENVSTVADVRREMNIDGGFQASVNGRAASDSERVTDNAFVTFAQKVKGGH